MRDKTNLWRLYNSSAAYGKRPSDFFQLETELAAWALDEACLLIGRKFENMLNDGKNPFDQLVKGEPVKDFASAPKNKIKKMRK